MRYSKEHKDDARQRLLQGSAQYVKRHGLAASGVDAIAAQAGVTSGSLYKHFAGKSELFAAMLRAELQRTAERFAGIGPGDADAAGQAVAAYLSLQHLRQPERGCPLPALTPEVARADPAVRAVFDEGLRGVHAQVQGLTGSAAKAWALIALNVGALMLARAALAPRLQRELLDSARSEGRGLVGDDTVEP